MVMIRGPQPLEEGGGGGDDYDDTIPTKKRGK